MKQCRHPGPLKITNTHMHREAVQASENTSARIAVCLLYDQDGKSLNTDSAFPVLCNDVR